MDKEKIFADGILWKDPHEKAPEYVKGELIVNAEKFNEFMRNNMQYASAKGWLNIQMKESKNGSIYFELNTWKPAPKTETPQSTLTSVQPDGSPPIDLSKAPF